MHQWANHVWLPTCWWHPTHNTTPTLLEAHKWSLSLTVRFHPCFITHLCWWKYGYNYTVVPSNTKRGHEMGYRGGLTSYSNQVSQNHWIQVQWFTSYNRTPRMQHQWTTRSSPPTPHTEDGPLLVHRHASLTPTLAEGGLGGCEQSPPSSSLCRAMMSAWNLR